MWSYLIVGKFTSPHTVIKNTLDNLGKMFPFDYMHQKCNVKCYKFIVCMYYIIATHILYCEKLNNNK